MELIKFILWLTAGAIIGWSANQIVKTERGWSREPTAVEVSNSEKS